MKNSKTSGHYFCSESNKFWITWQQFNIASFLGSVSSREWIQNASPRLLRENSSPHSRWRRSRTNVGVASVTEWGERSRRCGRQGEQNRTSLCRHGWQQKGQLVVFMLFRNKILVKGLMLSHSPIKIECWQVQSLLSTMSNVLRNDPKSIIILCKKGSILEI